MTRKVSDVLVSIEKGIEKISGVMADKVSRLVYLVDSNVDHEILKVTASTTERKIRFTNGPCKFIRIYAVANVYVDFDRAADTSNSWLIPAGTYQDFYKWVTEIHLVTSGATSSVQILGFR